MLATYPVRMIPMDIVVIDVLDDWGMLLSQKWAIDLEESIKLDLSYMLRFLRLMVVLSNSIGNLRRDITLKIPGG